MTAPRERLWSWLSPALLTALTIFQLGYSYGGPNHVVHLPWVLRRIDPSLLANDWFTSTVPGHTNGVAFMSWLGRFLPLPLGLLILHVASVFFVLWVTDRLVMLLFGDRRVLYVGLFLFLRWGTVSLGNNTLWGDSVVPHNVAVPFCLLAFYFMLQNRTLWAALAAAAATWIHIQLGAQTMLVLGLGMLLGWRRTGLRPIVLASATYLVAVAPTVVLQWMHFMGGPAPYSAREYLELHALLRQPHHLLPSSWPLTDYYRFFLVLALGAAAGGWRSHPHRTVAIWTAIILVLCIPGTVFVEMIPVKLFIRMQLFRITIFVKFFAMLHAARFLLNVVEQRRWPEKLCALAILTIQNFVLIGACAALIFALRQQRRWIWGLGVFAAGIVAGVTLVATTSGVIPPFWRGFEISSRGLWVGPLTLLAVAALVWRWSRLLPAALLALIVLVRIVFGMAFFGYDHPPEDPWYLFCRKVREATPRDAVILSPPHMGGLQLFAERAEVANFKLTPMLERDLVEWKHRLDDLTGSSDVRCRGWPDCAEVLGGGYARLREPDSLRLAAKYRAQYVITASLEHRLNFPEVLRFEHYTLYRVPH